MQFLKFVKNYKYKTVFLNLFQLEPFPDGVTRSQFFYLVKKKFQLFHILLILTCLLWPLTF